MRMYIRKLHKHDISHEISITAANVESFFSVNVIGGEVKVFGKTTKNEYAIAFYNSKDWRFGRDIKTLCKEENNGLPVDIGDILVFERDEKDKFEMSVINSGSPLHTFFSDLVKNNGNNDRHLTVDMLTDCVDIRSFNKNYAYNRIVFGAPGTGKSHKLAEDLSDFISNVDDFERVTFHPDFSYANFVGTLKPFSKMKGVSGFEEGSIPEYKELINRYYKGVIIDWNSDTSYNYSIKNVLDYINSLRFSNGEISYEYVPGPFMRLLARSMKSLQSENPKPFVLIIEEINRANVSAVFGDIFQLLDRDSSGFSEYEIDTSEEMREYLSNQLGIPTNELAKIRIPSNMFIWATMNSADQGVYPMDTAFKRRWDFDYIGLDEGAEVVENCVVKINDAESLNWNKLRGAINTQLLSKGINEDKLIGPFFISKNILNSENPSSIKQAVESKLLMYLFEDLRHHRKAIFVEDVCNQYSKVKAKFNEEGKKVFHPDIQQLLEN